MNFDSKAQASDTAPSQEQAVFLIPHQFQPRYQRNNKRGGLKNLRCFPLCGPEHKERGFCGRPVFLNVNSIPDLGQDDHQRLACWAQFSPVSSELDMHAGDKLPLREALSLERSKELPLMPWIRGKLIRGIDVKKQVSPEDLAHVVDDDQYWGLNVDLKGWHYGWASNKHSCNSEHCLQFFVFRRSNMHTFDAEKVLAFKQQVAEICQPLPHTNAKSSSKAGATESENGLKQGEETSENSSDEEGKVSAGDVDTKTKRKARRRSHHREHEKDSLKDVFQCTQEEMETVVMECVAVFQSPCFQLFCRRRRRFQVEPTAPSANVKQEQLVARREGTSTTMTQGGNGGSVDRKRKPLKIPSKHARGRSRSVVCSPRKEQVGLMQLVEAIDHTKTEPSLPHGGNSGNSSPQSKKHRAQSMDVFIPAAASSGKDDAEAVQVLLEISK